MIFLLLCLLLSAAFFIAKDLAIWSFFLLVPTPLEATQGALIRLERWSEYWCLPFNPRKCEVSSVNPHQANLQPNLLLFNSLLHFNPTPTFLGVIFDCTLFYSKHVSSLKAKFFTVSKLYAVSLLSHGSKEALSLSSVYSFYLAPFHVCFTWMVSFS